MKVLLGVSGGVAAYKAAELVRRLVEAGDEVRVVMTAAAGRFVDSRTYAVLSHQAVLTDLWNGAGSAVDHIELARWADVFAVAPATADVLAKLAHGLADDALTTVALAYQGPLLVAPSMNFAMLEHPATRANLQMLAGRGVTIVAPDSGFLAEGEIGPGRLPDPLVLRDAIHAQVRDPRFTGRRIVMTAGPTREAIDAVRYLSNPSSGKMGYALAAAAARRGASVTLISGPVELAPPAGVEVVRVVSAAEMRAAVFARIAGCDAAILVAAVADAAPATSAAGKLPKAELPASLALVPTPDILAELGRLPAPRPVLVGFAAERGEATAGGLDKLRRKNCDLLIANDVSRTDIGFGSDDNEVVVLRADGGRRVLEKASKTVIAGAILDELAAVWAVR